MDFVLYFSTTNNFNVILLYDVFVKKIHFCFQTVLKFIRKKFSKLIIRLSFKIFDKFKIV